MNYPGMDQQYGGFQVGPGPPLRNPPPQVFGAYRTDNSPGNGNMGASFYRDQPSPTGYDSRGNYDDGDDDDQLDTNDQGDAKRRRIARACDMCRKKKIKCDGKMPRCSHCDNYKTECIFTQVEKKRQPPKGAKYIEGLENRLGRMESLLRMSGLLAEDDGGKTDLGTLERRLADKTAAQHGTTDPASTPNSHSERTSIAMSAGRTPALTDTTQSAESPLAAVSATKQKEKEKEVEALADQMCSLVTNNCGETRYIGSASGFSIFSPKGIQWVKEKTGDNAFQDMISHAIANEQQWFHWKPDVFGDIFARRVFKPLPPKAEAMALLKDYFENFNCMFPLFHEPTFMHLVNKHYSMEPYEGSGWWASLNVALAIAHRLRVMSNVVPQEEDDHAWGYLKNALAIQTELTMRNNDLLSVQALLGMALFMQGTPNPHPSFFLVAAAIRLAHSLGLHKRGADFNLNGVETEQRKRVFWIAYMLDKDLCLRSGRPPIQDDDDMNVDLPSEDPPDNIGNVPTADGKSKINLFRTMCVFATIQSKVYKQLYSVKASRQSDGELLNTIGLLDKELEDWKDSIPLDFRPEHDIKASHTPLILHVVVLHFAYYNCLTTIHRMSVHHGYWTSRLSNYAIQGLNARPLNPRVFMSASLCVNSARTSISLIKYIPQGDYACVWLVLYYPVSALVTLFANILQNPQDARARSDLKLMSSVVQFLDMLASDESNGHVQRMLAVCAEFERISRIALDKAEAEMKGRGKRRHADKDEEPEKTIEQQQIETQASYRQPVMTPSLRAAGMTPSSRSSGTSPNLSHHAGSISSPSGLPTYQPPNENTSNSAFSAPTPSNQFSNNPFSPEPFMPDPSMFSNAQGFGNPAVTGAGYAPVDLNTSMAPGEVPVGGSFQQPFVPQDLWQMPMTLEWDWADVSALGNQMFVYDNGQLPDMNG